jgi:hypothetical protein
MTPEPRSVEASLEVLRALTDKYGWEPHCKAHAAALALLRSELDRLRGIEEAAAEVEPMAFRQYLDWSHFHELAMANPFHAEVEAQGFARRVSSLLTLALARPDRQEEGE